MSANDQKGMDPPHLAKWDPSSMDLLYHRQLTDKELAFLARRELMDSIRNIIQYVLTALPSILVVIKSFAS